jgi:ABC-type amino acid transport substrate-binding protein
MSSFIFRIGALISCALICITAPLVNAEQILSPATTTWLKANPTASYAPESDYGPFIYVDQAGKVLGLSVDFLQLIQQKTGLQFQAQAADSLSVNLEKIKQKQVDLLTSLRPTPERAAFLHFTTPYVAIPAALFLPVGQSGMLKEMNGRKIAVGKGYAVENFVRENFKQIQWVAVASDKEALLQMAAGKVDGLVADVASMHFLSQQPGAPASAQAHTIGFEYPLSFAYRKDKAELGDILQKGLLAISPQERDQLLQKWMPALAPSKPHQDRNRLLMLVGIALVFGVALSFLQRLRRQSTAQTSQ